MKKLLSCLLALLLLLQLLPTLASAEEEPIYEPTPPPYPVGIRVRTIKLIQGHNMDPEGLRYDLVSILQRSAEAERIVYVPEIGDEAEVPMYWDEMTRYFGETPVLTDDQDAAPWGLGEHTAHLSVGGYETDFTVVIEENPVQSVFAEDRYCIVNWDDLPRKNEEGLPETRVNIDSPEVGMYCTNGWTYTGFEARELAEEYHERITFRLPEGETWNTEPLTVGDEHTVLCEAFGLTVEYTLRAVDSPVETLSMRDVETYAWSDGWGWMNEGFDYNPIGFLYDNMEFTLAEDAVYVPEVPSWETPFFYCRVLLPNGLEYNSSVELSVGENVLTLNCLGRETQFCLRILPTPIVSVEPVQGELWETVDQVSTDEWNEETGTLEKAFRWYCSDYLLVDLTLNDGVVLRCPIYALQDVIDEALGINARPRVLDDQDAYPDCTWDLGAHSIELWLLGEVYTLPVEVVPCPVEAFSAADLTFTAHTHGSWQPCQIWNEETGEYEPDPERQWYRYDVDPQITLTMTDGSLLTGTPEEIEAATGHKIWINGDGQDAEYPLRPGKREIEVRFAGSDRFFDRFWLTVISDVVFDDVRADAWYAEAVQWALDNSITNGTSDTAFSPNKPCTRAQVMTFLWRAAGSPAPTQDSCPFTDIRAGAFYDSAVLWAVEQGITTGTTDTTFSPNKTCTRAEIVTFLWRAFADGT